MCYRERAYHVTDCIYTLFWITYTLWITSTLSSFQVRLPKKYICNESLFNIAPTNKNSLKQIQDAALLEDFFFQRSSLLAPRALRFKKWFHLQFPVAQLQALVNEVFHELLVFLASASKIVLNCYLSCLQKKTSMKIVDITIFWDIKNTMWNHSVKCSRSLRGIPHDVVWVGPIMHNVPIGTRRAKGIDSILKALLLVLPSLMHYGSITVFFTQCSKNPNNEMTSCKPLLLKSLIVWSWFWRPDKENNSLNSSREDPRVHDLSDIPERIWTETLLRRLASYKLLSPANADLSKWHWWW